MAQHDQVLENASGSAFRTDLNNALAALSGLNSGASQPARRVGGMFWFDTSSSTQWTLWLRNYGSSAWIKLFDMSASAIIGMGMQAINGIELLNGGPIGNPFRNLLINGDFDIWQRGTTQVISGLGGADRWLSTHAGSTKTITRQPFPVGPGKPKYYFSIAVVSVPGTTNYVIAEQRIEGVQTLAGKRATFTFTAKANAAKNICVEFGQHFGSGGSAGITSIGMTTCALTTDWKKFSFTVDLPSITGKVLGTANNDYLRCTFWFDAGSFFNDRSNSLGQQSGTFDICRVSFVEGDATTEDDPFSPRHIAQEMELCQRFYETSYDVATPIGSITTVGNNAQGVNFLTSAVNNVLTYPIPFKTRKRAAPSMALFSPMTGASGMAVSYFGTDTDIPALAPNAGEYGASFTATDARSTNYASFAVHWTATAEL